MIPRHPIRRHIPESPAGPMGGRGGGGALRRRGGGGGAGAGAMAGAAATRARARMARKAGGAPRKAAGGGAFGGFQNILAAKDPYAKAQSGTTAKGGQKAAGYKGSGQAGSAPQQDAQGRPAKYGGRVYALGPEGVDEYSPIYTPETFQSTGDTYAPGPLGLAVWAVGFAALLLVGAYAIVSTSQI